MPCYFLFGFSVVVVAAAPAAVVVVVVVLLLFSPWMCGVLLP